MQLSGKNLAYRVYNAGFILKIIKKTKEKGTEKKKAAPRRGTHRRDTVHHITRGLRYGKNSKEIPYESVSRKPSLSRTSPSSPPPFLKRVSLNAPRDSPR